MRIIFVGCVDFSYALLEAVMPLPEITIVGIVTRGHSSFNSDFRSLQPLATRAQCSLFLESKNNQDDMAIWMRSLSPDVVYCFGWPFLLKKDILAIPRLGAIGYHPTALPKNRGRHPIIWTLVLGLTETASSFFYMDGGADSGDLLDQKKVAVSPCDTAKTLYDKLKQVAIHQVLQFTPLLALGICPRTPQQHEVANYWRKRGQRDGLIDWRMSAIAIHNLVRALTRPYLGAHIDYQGKEIKVWSTLVLDEIDDVMKQNIEPGRVLAVDGKAIDVQCMHSVIRLIEHDLSTEITVGMIL